MDQIVQTIQRALPDARVFLDSPDGVHYQAVVVSGQFVGQPLVRQHQQVMKALKEQFDSERLHALQLKTMTPEQYESARNQT